MIDDPKLPGRSLGAIFAPARHRAIDATYAQALIAAQAQLLQDRHRYETALLGVDDVDRPAASKYLDAER